MSAPGRNGDEGSRGRRLYKLVGALVVALVIAGALVPLLLGGGQDRQTQLVEVQPEKLDESGGSGGSAKEPQKAEASGSQGASQDRNGEWWQPEDSEASGESGGTDEVAPSPTQEESAEPEAPAEGAPAEQTSPGPKGEPESAEESQPPSPEGQAQEGGREESTPQTEQPRSEGPYWTVMAGSFQDPGNATGLKERLGDQGFTAQVVAKTIEGRQWHRVYAGREGSRQKAEEVMDRLQEAGYNDLLLLKAE
ncbi:SPOR domain-containing protein [Thiohalorhabdus sp.]|uniref:SPOR domain-containing protein n=1 Tax=Thiohalorhabdus sp. TaxID=3094134 RepID=UPI002FC3D69E